MVYALAERADTLPLFLLYPYMYYVGCTSPCLIVVKVPRLVLVAIVAIGIIQYIIEHFWGEGRCTDANIGENLGFHEGKGR
jgi:hypothetical protein